MDTGSSSDEDVFECGRCRERFIDYDFFKMHKKNRLCKKSNTNKTDRNVDGLERNLSNNPVGLPFQDESIKIGNPSIEPNSNTTDLAEFGFISDIGNDSCKSATNSLLNDHDYMFLQTQVKIDTQTNQAKDKCMLCSVLTTNLHGHLENQHMIAKDKIPKFVLMYSRESVSCKLVKKSCETAKDTTVCKSKADLQSHDAVKLVCADCTTTFKTATLLKNHKCSTEKKCQHCDCSFTDFLSFMKHVCSKPGKAFCKKCKVQFLNSAHMENHDCSKNQMVGNALKNTSRTRRCSLCQFSSAHSSKLLIHLREQHMTFTNLDEDNITNSNVDEEPKHMLNNEKVKCRRCKRSFLSNNLEKHKLLCHEGKGKTCILCNHHSRHIPDYAIHVDTHKIWLGLDEIKRVKETEDNGENQCFFEDATNHNKRTKVDCSRLTLADLDKFVSKIKEQLFDAEETSQLIASKSNLGEDIVGNLENMKEEENSQKSHRNVNTRKCKSCGMFITADSLHPHMLVAHNKIKLFKCFLDSCMQIYLKLEPFNEHVKSHPENKDMLWCGCKTCVQVHPSGVAKRNELRKKTMRQYYQKLTYRCEKCWCKFPTEAGFKKHKMTETHNYPCHVCGKIQVSMRQLKTHILTHDTTRPYLCDICGLGYKTSRDLKKHRLIHNDARPFVCDACGKAFATKLKLNRHIQCVHNPVKRFVCTHEGCERKFTRKDKLKDHLNTHLAVEPFKCPYCNKGFSRSDNLRDHEVLHTRDYRFKCNMCNKGYMRPKLLEVHKQREHSDQQADKQTKQDANTFPFYTLYSQQPIQILPDAIQTLTNQTVQQLQQVVNEQQQQATLDVQYHQQALVNTAVPHMTVFDSL